jgi:peptidoglycan/LPS O-acetylase OafA/YrhL
MATCCVTALVVHRYVERPMTSFGNRVWDWSSPILARAKH